MRESYAEVSSLYRAYHLSGDPARVNFIDAKIAVILNGGYAPNERCSMGRREFAFGPEGNIYPCERLAGDCLSDAHRMGNLYTGLIELDVGCPSNLICGVERPLDAPTPCQDCSVQNFCMHWCGCSNFFSTGSYDRPGAFLCASEKEALKQAKMIIQDLVEEIGPDFINRLNGHRIEYLTRVKFS
jgi:uncharacterized protein